MLFFLTHGVVCVCAGFPNTGKSSVINSLKRSKACNVGCTPGMTKYDFHFSFEFLPSRRYASCGSVSVTSRCSIKTDERINLVFGTRLFFDQSSLCFKEIQVSTKIRALSCGTFF